MEILCNNQNGKTIWRRIDTCICITESLCCTPEINTTLLINYTPIRFKKTAEGLKIFQFYNKLYFPRWEISWVFNKNHWGKTFDYVFSDCWRDFPDNRHMFSILLFNSVASFSFPGNVNDYGLWIWLSLRHNILE